jgi:predicted dehydrogenase
MPNKIFAACHEGKFHNIEVEDDVTVYAEYANGATGVFITTTGEYPGTNRLEIAGTKGKLVIENGKLTHTALAIDEREFRLMEEAAENPVTITEITDEKYNGHIEILKNFARAILYGETLISPGYDGIFELTISNAAYLSSWTGKEIAFPMNDEAFAAALEEKKKMSAEKGKTKREDIQFSYKDRWNTNW